MSACGSRGTTRPTQLTVDPTPSEVTVTGDWNDVEASVLAAMDIEGIETAVLTQDATPREFTFKLITVLDQPGVLTASRDTDGRDLIPIRWTCSIGEFRDAAKERQILDAATARMKALAGVDYRPR